MQVEDLRRLIALAGHERVTDAAAVLRLTQPTLSRLLARVEHELGGRLFERDARGVHLNPNGALALAAARDIVDRYDRLRRDLADVLDPDSGTVRLAFLNSMATSLVPRLLREFRVASPHVRVTLRQAPTHDLLRLLADGTAEHAVLWPRPTGPHGWIPLQRQRLVLAVAPGHRLERRKRVRMAELADDDLVTVPTGFGFRTLVDDLYAADGLVPRVSFESEDLATVEGLAGAGLGVAILPDQQAGTSTVAVPLASAAAQRVVGLTWRSDRDLAPPAARFLDHVRAAGPYG
ncbi:LysR substrate-binding domain-containing protein [Virgisporangium aurantiacum]|uniref:LysR family transcriptional regulator n=1 Tax=Virgisporangium aurantiacum TaxID=175570 RepID=A0A8J4E4J3_9ACTN|nr:LysR substrate-binding domain-containing protein [Virgisporangium aurantiacum]GIJ61093.1 LysR family transcriptional regulator [Virgisporangium aurantiacum]